MVNIWKDLTLEKEKEYIDWTIDNWTPNIEINDLWHPVVRSTWQKLDAGYKIICRQIMADFEQQNKEII